MDDHNLGLGVTFRLYASANRHRHAALCAGHSTQRYHWLMPRSPSGGTVSSFLVACCSLGVVRTLAGSRRFFHLG